MPLCHVVSKGAINTDLIPFPLRRVGFEPVYKVGIKA